MTEQTLHAGFNVAVDAIKNGYSEDIRDLFALTSTRDGLAFVHAITDNSDKDNIVRVSHHVSRWDPRGKFEVAVNGQKINTGEETQKLATAMFGRIPPRRLAA